MSSFALPRTSLPGLEPLLDGDRWEIWVRAGRVFPVDGIRDAIDYVRLKPGTSCRLTVFGEDRGEGRGSPPGFLLQLYPDVARARTAFAEASARSQGVGERKEHPFLDEDVATVAIPFPDDPDLPVLRDVNDPRRLRRLLTGVLPDFPSEEWRIKKDRLETDLLAYKPGRRAVVRVRLRLRARRGTGERRITRHVKVADPETVTRARYRLERIHEALPAGMGWRVPRPFGLAGAPLFATEWVEGRPLLPIVRAGGTAAGEALFRTGRALAGLHALEVDLDDGTALEKERVRLRAYARDLMALIPDAADRIRGLTDALEARIAPLFPAGSATIHGDCHLGQVMLSGPDVWLVDLDRARRGHAASDLGRLLGHLLELRASPELAASLRRGYAAGSTPPSDALVRIGTALSVFRRAIFPFRSLDVGWRDETGRRLAIAEELVDRG